MRGREPLTTTEFWSFVTLVVAILISAAVINGGLRHGRIHCPPGLALRQHLGAGYFVSRGVAKSCSREPYTDEHDRSDR